MVLPIPLNCHTDTGLTLAGTGFLVSDGANSWLTTCLHLLTGERNQTVEQINFTGALISVVGYNFSLDFFSDGIPRVNVVEEKDSNILVDAMTLKLTSDEAEILKAFGSYNTATIVEAQLGDEVRMLGYAGLQTERIEHTVVSANVDRKDELRLALSEPSAKGMSGGPVESPNGLVGIIYGDIGRIEEEFSSATIVSLHVVGSYLLK